jgi:hypothetical protein
MTWVGAIAAETTSGGGLSQWLARSERHPPQTTDAARESVRARRWADLRDGVASTTPQAIGRGLLTLAVVGGSVWLAVRHLADASAVPSSAD